MKWVEASERLPESAGRFCVKRNTYGKPYYYVANFATKPIYYTGEGGIQWDERDVIQWLDESPSAPVEQEGQRKCVPGCKTFTGGEKKHHPDCVFYAGEQEGQEEMWKELWVEVWQLQRMEENKMNYNIKLLQEKYIISKRKTNQGKKEGLVMPFIPGNKYGWAGHFYGTCNPVEQHMGMGYIFNDCGKLHTYFENKDKELLENLLTDKTKS